MNEIARSDFVLGRWHLDGVLLSLMLLILGIGLTALASASVTLADRDLGQPFHYLFRQLFAVGLGVGLMAVALVVPTRVWEQMSFVLLLAAIALLVLVLVPGLGQTVNGATRWLRVGVINLQVSEPARLLMIMYVAGYMVRRQSEVATRFTGFLKPMLCVAVCCVLLLAQPDFGAATVLVITTVAMLFIGGARLRDFLLTGLVAGGALTMLALASPYRVSRLTSFMDPWADPLDAGFQLTQSLIAIGRGEWFGVGLGSSVQKLFYLPEAHTDFVFAVLAEELGLIGSVLTILLFAALVMRCFQLGLACGRAEMPYQAYLCVGIGFWLGLQAFINIGVNMGLLPTKGLTLPLVSYGRSSLLVTLGALGLLLRIHHELLTADARPRGARRRAVQ